MREYLDKKNLKLSSIVSAFLIGGMLCMTGCSGKGGSGDDGTGTFPTDPTDPGTVSMCDVPLEASLSTQERIGGAVTNVQLFMADDNVTEWTLYNIANELRATQVNAPESTAGLEVEAFIRDIEIVNYNSKRYALLAMGEEGITAVDISNPEVMVIDPNVESVKVNYYQDGINWTEGGGDIVPDNTISGTRGAISSLAVYNEGNATNPSMQLIIGDERYGLHKTALSNLFMDTNETREADGTLKIEADEYTLQYAGENPWGGPKSLTLYGEGNSTRLFVAQGFLGMGIYDPKTLDKVGYYNHYTDTNVTDDWFIKLDVSTDGTSIDSCTGMPDYRQANFEIQTVWHDKVDAPTPWADFDRYGKYYYDARRVDVATFSGAGSPDRTIAYIAYGLGGMVAVDVTGYDTATARDVNCTSNNGFLFADYLGYVPAVPAHGPDAQTGEQSQSLFPYFGVGMLKEAGIVDVKVDAGTKNVYFSDHFAGLMAIGDADNPLTWHGQNGAGQYNNDTDGIPGNHWPDYEFVTDYNMTEVPLGEESVPQFIFEDPILLATGELSGHGNVFALTDTFAPTASGAVDVVLAAGGGGLSFIDLSTLAPSTDYTSHYTIENHLATTDEIGAAADGTPTQEINIGHAEGVAAYNNLLYLADGPHGMSVWKIADDLCYPTDDVHLVANTLQSEYPVGDINPAPHAHEVILDHMTNSALVMSQSRGVRRVSTTEMGTVGAPVLLYPKTTDIYEHNKDEGNVADFLSMQDHAYSAVLDGPLAFTADGSNGLTVYDLSKDPSGIDNSNGFVVANIGGNTDSQPDLGRASGVALWDDTSTGTSYAFVAAGSRGIAVVDVTNVQDNKMTLIKIFEPIKMEGEKAGKADGKSVAVKIVGDYVFFTYDSFGIVCYSIADLIKPLESPDPQDIWTPGTKGERPEATARFKLQDASFFGRADLAGWGGGAAGMDVVSVNGKNFFYVAYGDAGVIKIDWTDPAAPVLKEHTNTVGFASDVVVINGRVYAADSGGGLTLLK